MVTFQISKYCGEKPFPRNVTDDLTPRRSAPENCMREGVVEDPPGPRAKKHLLQGFSGTEEKGTS